MPRKTAPGDELQNPLANAPPREGFQVVSSEQERIFRLAISLLDAARVPFLLAGAFATHAYSGAWRNTKDLDLFLRPDDVLEALDALKAGGFETELRDPYWLAKAWKSEYLIDLIFGMGNRALAVDDSWLERAAPIDFCGKRVQLLAIEDLIASKMYVAARDRFDGADILHLVLRRQGRVDWERVVERMGENRQLVLWHLVLFDWAYPDHRHLLPAGLMARLVDEARAGWGRSSGQDPTTTRGTLLDPVAFSIDTRDWGLRDGRPSGRPVRTRDRP